MKKLLCFLLCLTLTVLYGCTAEKTDDHTNTEAPSSAESPLSTEEVEKPAQKNPIELVLNEATDFQSIYRTQKSGTDMVIKGAHADIRLKLPATLLLRGDLTLENVTLVGSGTKIYANGHRLIIKKTVRASSRNDRLTVYGGGAQTVMGDTYLELLGGQYQAVFGGGSNAAVRGDTYLIFGGNANAADSADDSSANFSPCRIYGGGQNGSVGGSTNITIKDSAVAAFVCGAGSGSSGANVKQTNIRIQGGKMMNVFGGSLDSVMTDVQTHITMTGGMAEAIFGGSQARSLSGSTDIRIFGGEITRRLYTGCYNDCDVGLFSDTWLSECSVTGTTSLTVGPYAKLCTATELSSDNMADMGIFCGSRHEKRFSDEVNVLIFLDGCHANMISQIGASSKSFWDLCKSRHSYIYNCSAYGELTLAENGSLRIAPNKNFKAVYGGKTYFFSDAPNANLIKLGGTLSSPQTVKIVFQKE